jgi:hypothetical protein
MMLADGRVMSVVMWLAAALVILVFGLMWGLRLKRRLSQADEPAAPMGFTLSDLRQLHRSGQISDAEFARARDKIIEAAKKAAERQAPAPTGAAPLAQRGFDVLPPDGADPGPAPKP